MGQNKDKRAKSNNLGSVRSRCQQGRCQQGPIRVAGTAGSSWSFFYVVGGSNWRFRCLASVGSASSRSSVPDEIYGCIRSIFVPRFDAIVRDRLTIGRHIGKVMVMVKPHFFGQKEPMTITEFR